MWTDRCAVEPHNEGPLHGGPSCVPGPRGSESNRHLCTGQVRALPVESYVPWRGRRLGVKMGWVARDAVDILAR